MNIDGFTIPLMDFAPATLLGFAVLLLLMGWIVPRRTLNDKASECERWRRAYEAERKRADTADAQTSELLEVARTTHSLIEALVGNQHENEEGHDHHSSS
ncbi:MAG: hypothetical protein ACWGQW_12785 [bacterium]